MHIYYLIMCVGRSGLIAAAPTSAAERSRGQGHGRRPTSASAPGECGDVDPAAAGSTAPSCLSLAAQGGVAS